MSWSQGQINTFAKQIAQSAEGKAWWAFVEDVREALIDQVVLRIVLGQDRDDLSVAAIRDLRLGIARRLQSHHGLRNEHGEPEDMERRP